MGDMENYKRLQKNQLKKIIGMKHGARSTVESYIQMN